MSEDATTPTTPPPETPAAAASTNATDSLISKPAKRYSVRFVLLYGALAGIAIAAIVGFVVLVAKPSSTASASGWSDWKPQHGTTAKMTSEIADHVAREYHLNKKGAQLVAVVAGAPTVTSGTHKVSISHIAIRRSPQSDAGIQVVPSGKTWTLEFCGLGSQCSIASGQASETRGRLVRREALEAALYTFKFVPAIDSVVAFMPPPPGQSQSTLLYLQKSQLSKELSQPLRKTLPVQDPPLPTEPDAKESATIDRLTLPAVYSYKLQQLQDASALLVLDPFQS
jgi:hypothetical protein